MSWRRGARLGRATAVLVVLAMGLGAAAYGRSPRQVISNPGKFVGVAGPGSYYEYLDDEGNLVTNGSFDAGNPMCGDGIDNDTDTLVDEFDPQCVGPDDANERLAGAQVYTPSSLPVMIKANGVITLRPRDLKVQPVEKCLNTGGAEPWCLLVSPQGAGPAVRGSVRGNRITVPIPMTIKFDAATGYPGFDPRCRVGYTKNVYTGTYDQTTGVATLETGPENIAPGLTNCGEWTETINQVLSMPAEAHSVLLVELRNADGETPQRAKR